MEDMYEVIKFGVFLRRLFGKYTVVTKEEESNVTIPRIGVILIKKYPWYYE